LLEHLFSAEVMKLLWLGGTWRLEVLKPQVDDGGYDLVLEANGIIRHVQLKSSKRGSKVTEVQLNMMLAQKPSGCVVFMRFDPDTLTLGPFGFFGGAPGTRLPDIEAMKVGKHTKRNAEGVRLERPGIRCVPLSEFDRVDTIGELVTLLFGSTASR
jgi:hypothetical protein